MRPGRVRFGTGSGWSTVPHFWLSAYSHDAARLFSAMAVVVEALPHCDHIFARPEICRALLVTRFAGGGSVWKRLAERTRLKALVADPGLPIDTLVMCEACDGCEAEVPDLPLAPLRIVFFDIDDKPLRGAELREGRADWLRLTKWPDDGPLEFVSDDWRAPRLLTDGGVR